MSKIYNTKLSTHEFYENICIIVENLCKSKATAAKLASQALEIGIAESYNQQSQCQRSNALFWRLQDKRAEQQQKSAELWAQLNGLAVVPIAVIPESMNTLRSDQRIKDHSAQSDRLGHQLTNKTATNENLKASLARELQLLQESEQANKDTVEAQYREGDCLDELYQILEEAESVLANGEREAKLAVHYNGIPIRGRLIKFCYSRYTVTPLQN